MMNVVSDPSLVIRQGSPCVKGVVLEVPTTCTVNLEGVLKAMDVFASVACE